MIEYDARQTSDGTDQAVGIWTEDRAVIRCGDFSFFLRSPLVTQEPDLWDFAVFGLAAMSMYTNRTIHFDRPVSASAARAVERLNYNYRLWCMVSLSQPRLQLRNVVPDPIKSDNLHSKVICLSGGIDSTSTAICAKTEAGYTHGLLIAGADYPSASHPGFLELESRVAANAEILELELVSVETDFRQMPIDWELQHSFLLAMALHYHADHFLEGCYALDANSEHELLQHPWGNCSALMHAFSTTRMPLVPYGHQLSRAERAEVIVNHDHALLPNISVCWVDVSTGKNCGSCKKCQRTHAMFQRLGVPTETMFLDAPKPLRPESMHIPRGYNVRMEASIARSWAESLTEKSGDKILLESHSRRLNRAYVKQMPYR